MNTNSVKEFDLVSEKYTAVRKYRITPIIYKELSAGCSRAKIAPPKIAKIKIEGAS